MSDDELRTAAVRLSASHTEGPGRTGRTAGGRTTGDDPEVADLAARAAEHGLALVGFDELAALRRVLYRGGEADDRG